MTSLLASLVSSLLKPLVTLMAAWFGGKAAGRDAARIKELKGYVKTRSRMDEVGRMSDADAAADFLRDRAKH